MVITPSPRPAPALLEPVAHSAPPREADAKSLRQSVEVITLGCRLNLAESETIRQLANAALGDASLLVPDPTGPRETIIINSCAVTREAVRQSQQAIRRARRQSPQARIIVTGCAAQIDPQKFSTMPEIDQILGNAEKLQPSTYWDLASQPGSDTPKQRVGDIFGVDMAQSLYTGNQIDKPHWGESFAGRARAYLQVQNGCDHRCTFCVIPFGRGNSRSMPAGEVVRQAQNLVDAGYAEIVLTGVDLTSWGADLPGSPNLGNLVGRLLKLVPDLPRLRLSSVDAIEIDADLLRHFAQEERLAPFLHLSLQSGDDLILKRMKRRHLRADAIRLCQTLRELRPDIAFGADFIAGFPTETEAAFKRSLDLIDECGIAFLHVFPFSAHSSLPAANMPQIERQEIKNRAARLRAHGQAALDRHLLHWHEAEAEILLEQPDFGRLADFTPVRLNEAVGEAGQIHRGLILDHHDGALRAKPLRASKTAKTPAANRGPDAR